MGNMTLDIVIKKIDELKTNSFLPDSWASMIAERTGLTDTTIRNYAAGKKNRPAGPMLVLEHLKEIIKENEEKAKKLTA